MATPPLSVLSGQATVFVVNCLRLVNENLKDMLRIGVVGADMRTQALPAIHIGHCASVPQELVLNLAVNLF